MEPIRIMIPEVHEAIEKRDFRALKEALQEFHPQDIVDLLRTMEPADRLILFRLLAKDRAAEVFSFLELDEQKDLLSRFTEQNLKEIIVEMSPDDRTDLLDELPAGVVKRLLVLLDPAERAVANELLNYPESSAGRLMTPEFVDLNADMTVDEAIQRIRQTGPDKETIYYAYVTDATRTLKGMVSLRTLLLAKPGTRIEEIMKEEPIRVRTADDQESVAHVIRKYDLLAVPVVDREERLVGIVTVDDVVDVIADEATEDIQKMGAIEAAEEGYFQTGFFSLARRRILWLMILLVTATLSGSILEHYTAALQAAVILVFFIPMLMNTGGSTGTQSATLIIRGLATGEIDVRQVGRVVARESLMGVLLGSAMGLLGFLRAILVPGSDPNVWFTVGLTLILTVTAANMTGALLPIAAKLLRADPAIMAGPVIATIMDATTLLIYFEIARRLLGIG
ncbi:MAG: magnesium transporter [Nitrospirae bacterium RBG_16_64_22]|nr:MAG: magnesium transporter [Nitrospirae bacterium RBG_16_64_22]